jgi:hypothetical protein
VIYLENAENKFNNLKTPKVMLWMRNSEAKTTCLIRRSTKWPDQL